VGSIRDQIKAQASRGSLKTDSSEACSANNAVNRSHEAYYFGHTTPGPQLRGPATLTIASKFEVEEGY